MMQRLLLMVGGVAIAACGGDSTLPIPSFLTAHIEGQLSVDHVGDATYEVGRDNRFGEPQEGKLMITLRSLEHGNEDREVNFYGWGGVPQPGSYPIGLTGDAGAEDWVFAAAYVYEHEDGTLEGYQSVAGELTIVDGPDRMLVGTFSFEAVRYCWRAGSGMEQEGSCDPRELDLSHPRIVVNGEFAAKDASHVVEDVEPLGMSN